MQRLYSSALIFNFLFFATQFPTSLKHRGLQWDWALFADPDRWGSIPCSLEMRGLQWWFNAIVSLSPVLIVRATHFLLFSIGSRHYLLPSLPCHHCLAKDNNHCAMGTMSTIVPGTLLWMPPQPPLPPPPLPPPLPPRLRYHTEVDKLVVWS
jgi:hypothetical protein